MEAQQGLEVIHQQVFIFLMTFTDIILHSSNWTQLANFPSESRVAGTQFSFNGKGYIIVETVKITHRLMRENFGNIILQMIVGISFLLIPEMPFGLQVVSC